MNEKELTGYPSIDKPWLKYYTEEAINSSVPECSMYEYIWENNKNHLDDIALIYFNKKITYRKMFEMIDKTASSFLSLGIKEGDIVTICSLSTPETIYCAYAINKLGAIVNFEYVSLSENGFKESFLQTNPKVVITLPMFANKIFNAADETNIEKIIVIDLSESAAGLTKAMLKKRSKADVKKSNKIFKWKDFISTSYKKIKPKKGNDAVILHTGGTTGTPKGVLLENKNLNALALTHGNLGLEYKQKYKILHGIPPFHSYGFGIGIHTPLIQGLSIVMCPLPSIELLKKFYKKLKPELLVLGVSQMKSMFEYFKQNTNKKNNLKLIAVGGENVPTNLEQEVKSFLENNTNAKLIVGYGMSELASAATSNLKYYQKNGSVGVPFVNYNVKIVDEKQNELKYNEIGEICFNTPTMMKEYFNNADETKLMKKIHKDKTEWMHTGDLGYVDEDGFIFIKGRIKRIYSYIDEVGNTYKIFPDYIENVVSGIGSVNQCAAGCIKSDKCINKIYCFITLNNEASKELIKTKMQKLLPEYNYPHIIIFKESIPLNAVGKVDYTTLEKEAEKIFREKNKNV